MEVKMDSLQDTAKFHQMINSTQEDWTIIDGHLQEFYTGLVARIENHLMLLKGDTGGFAVDRLEHSLQTATRAHRDGRGEAYVAMALLHDVGDVLGSYNHAEICAAMIRPFVSEEIHWIARYHNIFQGYYFFHYLGA
jgi:predicted HD phosphohydrolase